MSNNSTNAVQTNAVSSRYIERCQPFIVEMSCGHRFTRKMREATAGIPWTPEAVIHSAAPCQECFTAASKGGR